MRAEGVEFDWLIGSDLTESVWDIFFEFYTDTGGRKWGHPYLTRGFFSRVGAKHGGSDAAGDGEACNGDVILQARSTSFGDGVLYRPQLGLHRVRAVPAFRDLRYYQAIEFAIARGLKKVEAGAQGAHKLLRGYMPTTTYSAHYIAHPGLRRAVDDYLKREREAVAEHIEELAEHGPFRKIQVTVTKIVAKGPGQ